MAGLGWPQAEPLPKYPKAGRRYVEKYGKYRSTSWKDYTRDWRRRIDPKAYAFAERRMQGKFRDSDPHTIEKWPWQDDVTFELQSRRIHSTYIRKVTVRARGSPFFRNVVWPPQDKHDRAVPIPVPSTSAERYSRLDWSCTDDQDLFTHVFLHGWSVAYAAGLMGKTEEDCTERYREIFQLPLSREHRLRLDWTADEDRELLSWVDDLGERDWIRISHFLSHHQETCKFKYKQLKGDGFNTEIMDEDEADTRLPLRRPFSAGLDLGLVEQEDLETEQDRAALEMNTLGFGTLGQDGWDAAGLPQTPTPEREDPNNRKRSLNEDDYEESSNDEGGTTELESRTKGTRLSSAKLPKASSALAQAALAIMNQTSGT